MADAPAASGRPCSPGAAQRTVALPVIAGTPTVRPSRTSRWRAAVLIAIHLFIALHVVQWLSRGLTLSPVEPSETIYTLEKGEFNAGFVLFVLAIMSTFLFGRFFCGWGCHVVALQDLCAHWMKKLGVHPKPLRSRLLLWWPVLLATYMFLWPTLRREALFPALQAAGIPPPFWLGQAASFPGLHNALVVEDFWATFPAWYVAIPFLALCGFGAVYLLGSKGFCTYACPYGGVFGPVDRLSIGRIVVSDACEGCGHCTATCTSNVRVHQEVRDYGMVVDPGCMKCMDCVSVCPNHALSFSFARPAAIVNRRTTPLPGEEQHRPRFEFLPWEEVVVLALGIALLIAWRGAFNQVPLLMAGAIGAAGAFAIAKAWRILRTPNVRLQSLQLRVKGRHTLAGRVLLGAVAMFVAASLWTGWVRASRWRADLLDAGISVSQDAVFRPGYIPHERDARHAALAIASYQRTAPPSQDGWGWPFRTETLVRLAWLHAVRADFARSEEYLRQAVDRGRPNGPALDGLWIIMGLRGGTMTEFRAVLDAVLARHPDAHHARVARALTSARRGDLAAAADDCTFVLRRPESADDDALVRAGRLLMELGRATEAADLMQSAAGRKPGAAGLRILFGETLMLLNRPAEAIAPLRGAAGLRPREPGVWELLAHALEASGIPEEAREARIRADTLAGKGPLVPQRPPRQPR